MKLSEETTITIDGIVTEYETSIEYPVGYRETTVTIRELEPQNNLMHKLSRCNTRLDWTNREVKEEKEDKNMSVRIRKQPKEITLEELKKGEEYEKVIIHIDNDKKNEIENRYGICYDYAYKLSLTDAEIKFKENYLIAKYDNVPYEIINKIEVVEK